MPSQGWRETLTTYPAGTARTAAAEDEIVDDFLLPAGYMKAGRMLKLHLVGKASNAVTTPGTLTVKIRWGTITGTVLVTSAALAQNVAAQTDKTWTLEAYILCLTSGSAGTFLTWGTMHRGNCAVGATSDITPDMLPASSLAAVTVDTTVEKALTVTVTPSLGTASIQCLAGVLESLN
jgi:hypothetical protein